PNSHSHDSNSHDPNSRDPTGCIVILTINDVSWFKKEKGEWRTTTAGQPFFDIRDIQTDRGFVIGNIGDQVYRHRRVLRFLGVVGLRGWMMIVERFRRYAERIQR